MNIVLRISLILGICIYFFILLSLIKRKSLNLKYTLLWIFLGIIMFVITIFPKIMITVTRFFGIVGVINGVFALILFFVLIMLMSLTGIVSKMKEKNTKLIQECALMEKRVRNAEKKLKLIKGGERK